MSPSCVIAGSGGLLGQALARRFGAAYPLGLLARNATRLAEQQNTLEDRGIVARAYPCDLNRPDSLAPTIDRIEADLGPVEVMIYNAATVVAGRPLQASPTEFAERITVNLVSAFAAVHRVAPTMRSRGVGSILFTGGGLALEPESAYSDLTVGKSGLRALALCLADELAPAVKVAVMEICGAIKAGTTLDPDALADRYFDIHSGSDRTTEVICR